MAERERVLWRGEVVTVIDRKPTGIEIRDGFGYTHTVRKREISKLPEDDPRRTFNATTAE